MVEWIDRSATEISKAIRLGRLKPSDLMAQTLVRIAGVNPTLNAIVSMRDEAELMALARAKDRADPAGPLHGIPIAVKDLANVAGISTSMGSPLFKENVAQNNDLFVDRMIEAGAIVIGKTNTPEFGLGSHTFNPVFGATKNAVEMGRSAGGSSGGAAVALASGMLCLADGSDMMGSLRNPAGWNGVYGMRPTWGLIPSEPVGDLFAHPLSTNGPMARTVADIALLLDVMAGPATGVPYTVESPAFVQGLRAGFRGCRIAWLSDWGGAYPMEEGVLEAANVGRCLLEQAGCVVEDVPPPFPACDMWQSWTTLRAWSLANKLGPIYDQPDMRAALKPEAIWEVERGRALTGQQIQRASSLRSDWYRAATRLFSRYDVFALPTAQCWPFPVEWDWPSEIAGRKMDTYHRWMEVVVPVSLIGLPCLAVPVPAGRPMGLQLAGPRGKDLSLLLLGAAYEDTKKAPG